MQLFKDKQLRFEFEKFKKEINKKVTALQKENQCLINENTILREKLETQKIEVNQLFSKLEKVTTKKTDNISPKHQSEVIFGENPINKDAQVIYKSLSFDGFWFKNTRGKSCNQNQYNIHQIILLKKLGENTFDSWVELSKSFGVSSRVLQRIAYNILEGTFDKYIEEYCKTKFSLRKGVLYINGQYTKISEPIACELVITYVNDPSEETLKKLIKSYPNTQKEHIITICDNYKSVPLKSNNTPINIENNPQKRKEKGMS